MTRIDCENARTQMHEALDAGATSLPAGNVADHIAACAACAAEWEVLRRAEALLRDTASAPPAAPPTLRAGIMEAIDAATPRSRPSLLPAGVAALAGIAAVTFLMLHQPATSPIAPGPHSTATPAVGIADLPSLRISYRLDPPQTLVNVRENAAWFGRTLTENARSLARLAPRADSPATPTPTPASDASAPQAG